MAKNRRDSMTSTQFAVVLLVAASMFVTCLRPVRGLSTGFYASTCANLESTVKDAVNSAIASDPRVGASMLRVHFHDCFVDGCDGSVLLDDTASFTGEKTATQNAGSLRGFDAIDNIKSAVEEICPKVVSCADILAIVARDSVVHAGGPSWDVELGRFDSLTASKSDADASIPSPFDDLSTLTSSFSNVGLSQTDLAALSGAHTFGKAQCGAFRSRLYDFQSTGSPDPTLDTAYLQILQARCPDGGDGTVLNDLDQGTPTTFDNSYYSNLLVNKGLLSSDQVLESTSGAGTQSLVSSFGGDQGSFFSQFAASMIKMGAISPKSSSQGEIRTNCRVVNSA